MYIDLWEAKWLTSQLSRDILASVGLNLGKWIWQDRRTQQTPLHAGYLSVVGGCSSHIWGYPCWVLNISYTWYGYNLSMYIIYILYVCNMFFFQDTAWISGSDKLVIPKGDLRWTTDPARCRHPLQYRGRQRDGDVVFCGFENGRPTRLAIKWWSSIGITSHFYIGKKLELEGADLSGVFQTNSWQKNDGFNTRAHGGIIPLTCETSVGMLWMCWFHH